MYCRNCGKQVEDDRELCAECEAAQNTTTVTSEESVQVIKEIPNNNQEQRTNYEQNNGTTNTNSNTNSEGAKSKIAAGLFGIFLGAFGVHNFYLGFTGKAIAQLLITVLSCGMLSFASALWGLIEGILILTGEINKDANGTPLNS